MDDTISRQAAIDVVKGIDTHFVKYIQQLPSALPEPCEDDPRADVYYLAEKIGIHQLYALVVQLRGEPEPCEDAVSRKDCLKALSNMMDTDGFRNGWAVSRANVECMLKSMPPVTPKQRTGYWYPVGMAEVVGGESAQWGSAIAYHRCSECDEQALRDDFEQEVLSKWCPHCGTKMMGVNNETD